MQSLVSKFGAYGINLGILDCTKIENKKACLANKPTTNSPISFSLFFDTPKKNPYTHVLYREPVVYPGIPASNKDLEKWVNKALQPKNLKILEFNNVEGTVSSLNKPAILVFSEKKSNPNVYLRSLFAKYAEVDVFFVPTPDKESDIEEFQYDNLPSMFFVDPSLHQKAARFDGVMTDRSSVSNWIETVVSTSSISKKEPDSSALVLSSSALTDEYFRNALVGPDAAAAKAADKSWKTIYEAVIAVVARDASDELAGWDKALATTMTGSIRPIEITCDKGQGGETTDAKTLGELLCKDRVDGKPYVLVLPHNTALGAGKSYYKLPYATFDQNKHGVVDNEEWIKHIGKSLPESVVEMLPEDENAINYFMQMAITKEMLPIVIFSQKQVVSSVVRNTAMDLTGKVAFGFVFISSDGSTLHRHFGVNSLPSVVAMQPQMESEQMKAQRLEQEAKVKAKGQNKNQKQQPDLSEEDLDGGSKIMIVPRPYSTKQFGQLTFQNLKMFASAVLETGYYPGRMKREEENLEANGGGSSVRTIVSVDVNDNEKWTTECSSKFRGLCIVYLHDGRDVSLSAGRSLLDHLGSSPNDPSKTLRDAMKLINIDAQCQFNFLSTFGIDMTALPMVITISPLKLKYSIYRGSITPEAVGEFVASIFKGKGSLAPLSTMPSLELRTSADFTSCLQYMNVDGSGGGGGGGADAAIMMSSAEAEEEARLNAEILEEIKREEEEKKKRLVEEEKARKQKEKEDKLKAEQEAKEKKSATSKKKKKKSKKSKKDDDDEL